MHCNKIGEIQGGISAIKEHDTEGYGRWRNRWSEVVAMAYDSDEGAFHLTPAGWLRVDDEPFPADRIETWRYSMHKASGWSREHRSLYCEWADHAIAREERDTLRKKYGWPYGLTPSRDTIIGSAP